MEIEKNKEYIVDIIDNGFQGEGIAKINNFTIFIPNAIKGEKVKILIVKKLSSHAFGKIIEIISPSEFRTEADCKTYKRCGGCNLRHIKYKETLKMKQNAVQSLVNKTLKNKVEVKETLGMENPYYYRNKVQYPVQIDKNGKAQIGVFANRSHEIVPVEKCLLQNEKAQNIAKEAFEIWKKLNLSIYNEQTNKGLLRHIVVKASVKTNQYMCILVINGNKIGKEDSFTKELVEKFPEIKSVVLNVNTKNTNVILGTSNIVIFGKDFIEDKLGEFIFRISPLSFYQVNPVQAEKLYMIGVEAANITKNDVVFDLYCGIGTISLFMSKFAKKVYGVEIVQEAVNNARVNAEINNVTNVEFFAGDTKEVLDSLIYKRKIIPDIVMVDPPRRGLEAKSIEDLLEVRAKRIVYISCNPATLVRDLGKLEEMYEVLEIRPVDMFPFTSHVEVCALLELKNCQSS